MRINNNIMAMNTHRQYTLNTSAVAKSTEKLSSGYRINRAGDDAAGLAISEKMRAQIRGLKMASKNSQDAISLVQTAEGALQETHNILQRMRELSVQSASDTNEESIDRAALNAEFQQLISEVDDTAIKTKFNDMGVIDGSFQNDSNLAPATATVIESVKFKPAGTVANTAAGGHNIALTDGTAAGSVDFTIAYEDGTDYTTTVTAEQISALSFDKPLTVTFEDGTSIEYSLALDAAFAGAPAANATALIAAAGDDTDFTFLDKSMTIQTGANRGDELKINIDAMDAETLGIDGTSIATRTSASDAIAYVNRAVNRVSSQRADLGALQNRLGHKINNLDTSAENLAAAESRIRDLDMANEMTTFTRNNIITQAATAMLAQANSAPQGVLSLLQQ